MGFLYSVNFGFRFVYETGIIALSTGIIALSADQINILH